MSYSNVLPRKIQNNYKLAKLNITYIYYLYNKINI